MKERVREMKRNQKDLSTLPKRIYYGRNPSCNASVPVSVMCVCANSGLWGYNAAACVYLKKN